MIAYGAELIVHGADFDESLQEARRLASEKIWQFMPSLDADLIPAVATYALEFFRGAPVLDRLYVPMRLGSGICGVVAAKKRWELMRKLLTGFQVMPMRCHLLVVRSSRRILLIPWLIPRLMDWPEGHRLRRRS